MLGSEFLVGPVEARWLLQAGGPLCGLAGDRCPGPRARMRPSGRRVSFRTVIASMSPGMSRTLSSRTLTRVSQLHLRQIKRHLEDSYLPHVDQAGASQEHHRLSRAIAALALSERTGLPPTTASASVTDHPKDGGIDGVAYAAERAALVFVQSKWTEAANTGISQGDVMKFVGGVRRVVNGDWSGFGGRSRTGTRRSRTSSTRPAPRSRSSWSLRGRGISRMSPGGSLRTSARR